MNTYDKIGTVYPSGDFAPGICYDLCEDGQGFCTPVISIAVTLDDQAEFQKQLQNPFAVNAADSFARTPLFAAVNRASRGMVSDLLKHGANARIEDNGGNSLKSEAEGCGDPVILQMVIDAGG